MGDPLTNPVQPSHVIVGLESAAENIRDSRVLPWEKNTVANQESRAIRADVIGC